MSNEKSNKMARGLCKYSDTKLTSYRPCPSWYDCESCEFEQALVDWKRGQVWVKLVMGIPYFFKCHTWAKMERNGTVKVGVDDFAQRLLGEITGINLPKKGEMIKQEEYGWQIRCGSRSTHLLSPIDGEIIGINQELLEDSSMLNKDPYGKGWILTLKPLDLDKNSKFLLSGEKVKSWLEEETDRLHRRVEKDLGVTIADGGELVQAIGEKIDNNEWRNLVRDFLLKR